METKSALEDVLRIVGGQSRLATVLGVKPQAVQQWAARAEVPPERVLAVAAAAEFQVSPHRLRPDLYPHPDDGLPVPFRVFGALDEYADILTDVERQGISVAIGEGRKQDAIRLIEALDVAVTVRAALLAAAQRTGEGGVA